MKLIDHPQEYKGIDLHTDEYYIPYYLIQYVINCDKKIRSFYRKLSKQSISGFQYNRDSRKVFNIKRIEIKFRRHKVSYKYNPKTLSLNKYRDDYNEDTKLLPHRIVFRGDMSIVSLRWFTIREDRYRRDKFISHRNMPLPAHITFHKTRGTIKKYYLNGKDATDEFIRKKYLENV